MKICVYCSSSDGIDQKYFQLAQSLGTQIGKSGHDFVFGGVDAGLMGETAKAAKAYGSKITGILPELIHKNKRSYDGCDDVIITKDMRDRKQSMEELSDAFIALPGGIGTIEELTEVITGKQLTYHNKPIVILDCDNYYSPFIHFLDNLVNEKFAHEGLKDLYKIAHSPEEAISYIESYTPTEVTVKWHIK